MIEMEVSPSLSSRMLSILDVDDLLCRLPCKFLLQQVAQLVPRLFHSCIIISTVIKNNLPKLVAIQEPLKLIRIVDIPGRAREGGEVDMIMGVRNAHSAQVIAFSKLGLFPNSISPPPQNSGSR